MAQRRPHGQEQDHSRETSAAAWRAEVLKEDHSEPIGRDLEQLYASKPNPARRKRPASQESIEDIKRRSDERIRREQERRLQERRRAAAERQQREQGQIRLDQQTPRSSANRPRKMSEEDLQEILLQVRKERAEKQGYEEVRRRPRPEVRQRPQQEQIRQAGQKTERRQPERPRQKKEKKVFSKGFKKGFFIAWGVFVLLLVGVLAALWIFLSRYESGLPEHYMNQIIEDLRDGNMDSLHVMTPDEISIDDPSLFSARDSATQYLKEKNAENTLRYVKVNAESTSDENVYMIRSGDENILKLYLDRDAADSKKNRKWEETKTLIASENLQVGTVTAQIPTSCSLVIDGKAVDRSFITEEGSRIQLLSRLIDEGILTDAPTVDTYAVRGIFAEPEITMTDANGTSRPCTKTGDVYAAGFEADNAFVSEQTERVLSLFEPYAKYFSGDAGRDALNQVMLDNSPAFVSASSADVSWMQEHDGIALSEESVTNFKKYSDNVYSCDIRFVQDILRDGEVVRTWDTNMTWIMVKDGNYYLADLLTKTSDD